MSSIKGLQDRIKKIESRNAKVEADKAWETSLTRRSFIALSTYLIIGLFMNSVGVNNPWTNALVPTAGFIISTLSLPFLKQVWLKYNHK